MSILQGINSTLAQIARFSLSRIEHPAIAQDGSSAPNNSEILAKDRIISSESPRSVFDSLALRFGGFAANLTALIEPVCGLTHPAIARKFFREKLDPVYSLATRNPAAAFGIIESNTNPACPIWGVLLRVACGDSKAALTAIDIIESGSAGADLLSVSDCAIYAARKSPLQGGHVLRRMPAAAEISVKLNILSAFVENDIIGGPRIIGELFVELMEGSSAAEYSLIYQAILNILEKAVQGPSSRAVFLKEMLRGWLSECAHNAVNKAVLDRLARLPF